MQPTTPYQSKLIPFQKEIFRMWYNERATLKAIQAWLLEQKIQMTLSGISGFIRRRRNGNDPHEAVAAPLSFARKSIKKMDNRQKAINKLDALMGKCDKKSN